MAHRGRLSARDRLATLLAAGDSVRQAAKDVGVSERTAHRWIEEPSFARKVTKYRAEMTDRAFGKLTGALNLAVVRLRTLIDAKESVALGAAKAIFDAHFKFRTANEFESRLAELERVVNERRTMEHGSIGRTAIPNRNGTH